MPGSETHYTTRDGETLTGYLTQPDGDGKLPGLLVMAGLPPSRRGTFTART